MPSSGAGSLTTAVAAPPVSAPRVPPGSDASPPTYPPMPPSSRHAATPSSKARAPLEHHDASPSSRGSAASARARSPPSARAPPPQIFVKQEPSSPDAAAPRHRPQRLDLSKGASPHSSGALTARPAPASSTIQEFGLACLSPGFHTQDPAMREHLQRSIDVREQQRQIIEARQKGKTTDDDAARHEPSHFGRTIKTPTSRRKGPPPGLSIAPPSHQQFAKERVVQSAPLNQSFTGLHPSLHTSRPANAPSALSQPSHIHHVPVTQTNNRLPSIADVFPEPLAAPRTAFNHSPGHSSHSNHLPPLPSPGHPAPPPPTSARMRAYKSAEDAVQSLSGGREDLLPRIVHYGGHQPPTPPSPMPPKSTHPPPTHPPPPLHRTGSRRRGREEYEKDMGTPPLPQQDSRPVRVVDRASPGSQQKRKAEFLDLASKAWDLLHDV